MVKKLNYLFIGIVLISFYSANAGAFGVVANHWRGNPVNAPIGGILIEELGMQNMVGNQDYNVLVKMKDGVGIATTPEQIYLVKAQTMNTKIPITIRIPEGTEPGTKYTVTVSFATVDNGGDGAVTLGTAIDTSFDVLAASPSPVEAEVARPVSNINLIIGVIVALIIIVALILWLIKRKRKNVRIK